MENWKKEWRDAILEAVLIIAILYLLCWPVRIDGNSMKDTLVDGDRVVVSRVLKLTGSMGHGDLIVFQSETPQGKISLIKRIIAQGGDYVEVSDGAVWINGAKLEEGYAKGETKGDCAYTVPKDSFFVLGDNREKSVDSRMFGLVKKKEVTGRVIVRFYPFSKMQTY